MFDTDEWRHAVEKRRVCLELSYRKNAACIVVREGDRKKRLLLETPEQRLELFCQVVEALTPDEHKASPGQRYVSAGSIEATVARVGDKVALVWTRQPWREDPQYEAPSHWTIVELDRLRLQMLKFMLEGPPQSAVDAEMKGES